ncbi:MAG: serine protease [Proteobacteria bacterium]|nr:MAG: serine protease [Pseudomonadota bacterium]
MRFLSSLFLLCAFVTNAHANLPELRPEKNGIGTFAPLAGTDDYRLGDEWGKRPVNADELTTARAAFRRGALATAKTGGATGFYLGKFAGVHVMATNHHVYEGPSQCLNRRVNFPLLGVSVTCKDFLGSWPEVDLALFVVEVAPADEAKLGAVAANFQFNDDIKAGQKLLTIGFGVAGNWMSNVMANEDSDCYVFSKDGEYRQMADPDRWNPGTYRAWSFALGCDVSHGDSGSAILDRESGKVIGIIWTGRIPKSESVQRSDFLSELAKNGGPEIWEELSYAVPAKKIGEHLRGLLGSSSLPQNHRAIIEALLK